ncbi:MAG: hexokinase [Treponema sp.]|jgi:hexokinase|nr:hexokinase [Treponema sp.]
MKFDPQALSEFAEYYGFHYDIVDPLALKRDVLIDMERGLKGEPSSLPMLPAYLSPVSHVSAGKTVIALDAGGTNFRAALVHFDEKGQAVAEGAMKAPMPGTKGRVGVTEFFDHIADLTAPLLEKQPDVEGIGFTFSYPMEMTTDLDGILLGFSKEIDAPDVIGAAIGQGLRDALARRSVKAPQKIVLINDTAATLLSGVVQIKKDGGVFRGEDKYHVEAGPVVGFILGTGFNTAYPEKAIPKINFNNPSKPQIVVCETGGFAHRYMGILDKEFDAATKNPGVFHEEKLTSGAYLGPLTFVILKRAIKDGVVAFRRSGEFLALNGLQTRFLNEFMYAPLSREGVVGELFGEDERDALASLVYLTTIVTERGARLAAGALAAVVEKTAAGLDPFVPVRIAIEGTTYMIYKGMRRSLESYLHIALTRDKPFNYVVSPVEQASLFGAAVAALSA